MRFKFRDGTTFQVSDSDAALVRGRRWYHHKSDETHHYVASKSRGKTVYLHRLLMNPSVGQVVDHINGNGLDNRRSNLRVCTQSQNLANARGHKRRRSKGVWQLKKNGRWTAQVSVMYRRKHLGYFATRAEARRVYVAALKEARGDFART